MRHTTTVTRTDRFFFLFLFFPFFFSSKLEGCCSSSSSFVVDRWWLVAGEHVKWSGLRGIKGRVGAGRRHRCECSQITSASLRPTLEPRKKRYEKDGWIDGWLDGWMDGWMDGWRRRNAPLGTLLLTPPPSRVYTRLRIRHSHEARRILHTYAYSLETLPTYPFPLLFFPPFLRPS